MKKVMLVVVSFAALMAVMTGCNNNAKQERQAMNEPMKQEREFMREAIRHRSPDVQRAVSYTHLTLPTMAVV